MGSRFGIISFPVEPFAFIPTLKTLQTAFPGLGDLLYDTTCNSALSVRNLNGSCSIVSYLIYPSLIQLKSAIR